MVEVTFIKNKEIREQALNIRHQVFVEEQGVSAEEEYDQYEDSSRHFLAYVGEGAAGTARWRFTENGVKLERFAVLPQFRGRQVGAALVRAVVNDIQKHPDYKEQTLYLHAQERVLGFYAKLGFQAVGDRFWEANIPHFKMIFSE